MQHKEIRKFISHLKQIVPDAGFSARSKADILSLPHALETDRIPVAPLPRWTLDRALRGVLASATALAILFGIYFATTQLSPLFLPGLNQSGILAEADMINHSIDVQLSHIQKFEDASQQSSALLKELTSNGPAHLNSTVLKKEQATVNAAGNTAAQSPTSTMDKIDDILNIISQ